MRIELIKTFQFEAAHARGGKLHGHSYVIDITCAGECDETLGWLVDYGEISNAFDPIYRALDHRKLEDVDGLDDVSLSGVEGWVTARIAHIIPFFQSVRVRIVGNCTFALHRLDRPGAFGEPARLRFGFESAHFLPKVPAEHKCRRMHGHSFQVDIAAAQRNDLEPHLRPVYDALDRQCLNGIAGLENATSERIAQWIWKRLSPVGCGLHSVTVAETCTARCVYRGE